MPASASVLARCLRVMGDLSLQRTGSCLQECVAGRGGRRRGRRRGGGQPVEPAQVQCGGPGRPVHGLRGRAPAHRAAHRGAEAQGMLLQPDTLQNVKIIPRNGGCIEGHDLLGVYLEFALLYAPYLTCGLYCCRKRIGGLGRAPSWHWARSLRAAPTACSAT